MYEGVMMLAYLTRDSTTSPVSFLRRSRVPSHRSTTISGLSPWPTFPRPSSSWPKTWARRNLVEIELRSSCSWTRRSTNTTRERRLLPWVSCLLWPYHRWVCCERGIVELQTGFQWKRRSSFLFVVSTIFRSVHCQVEWSVLRTYMRCRNAEA